MSDYFETVRSGLAAAVDERAHLPWWARFRLAHGRALAVVFAALVVSAPAAAAVSGLFSQGQPYSNGPVAAGTLFGIVKPGASRMLPIEIPDLQGGPPWGLRLVRTTRGDTCVQLGRVQNGQLGSLGIADAWNNDHRFHAIPPSARAAESCGSTDAAGDGFVNVGTLGESASASLGGDWLTGPAASGCRLAVFGGAASRPVCPTGSNRIIFYGLLGPDAVSVTYRTPSGELATERTVRGVGAYLLVFPYNDKTCAEYSRAPGVGESCAGKTSGGLVPGAVVKVSYTHGRSCDLERTLRLQDAFLAFRRSALRALGRPALRRTASGLREPAAAWRARYGRLFDAFLRREHLTSAQLTAELSGPAPRCPAIGWVPFKTRHVTRAEVASAVALRKLPAGFYGCPNTLRLPGGCDGITQPPSREIPVEWSFTARLAVTNSRSSYAWNLAYPNGCGAGGESYSTDANIHAGQRLRYSTFLSESCHGTYRLTVSFNPPTPSEPSGNSGAGPTSPANAIPVGHASFTIH